jgi:hypothetical protein
MNVPEYLQYFDYHLSLKILDFQIKENEGNNSALDQYRGLKNSKLFQTLLFREQEASLSSTKVENNSIQQINQKQETISKLEEELKVKIIDFLQLAESCRSLNDYDTSTSYRKKIVRISLNVRLTKLLSTSFFNIARSFMKLVD